MAVAANVGLPDVVERVIRNKRTGETRTFQQSELTIEGEARLIRIVHETAVALNEVGFPWTKLGPLFDEGPTDWDTVIELLGITALHAPKAIADATATFFGVYPTDEDGSRNDDYDKTVRFIRSSIKVVDFVEFVKTFTEQNDYQRLADPIGAVLGQASQTRAATKTNTSDTSTGEPSNGASSKRSTRSRGTDTATPDSSSGD